MGSFNLYLRHKEQFESSEQRLLRRKSTRKADQGRCRQFGQYGVYYFRGFISIESQILHTTGSWTFFDTYLFAWRWQRDVGYVVAGVLGLWWSRALVLKACITPFNVSGGQPDGLLQAIKRQDDFQNFHRNRART